MSSNKYRAVSGFYSAENDSLDSFKKYSDSQWFASKQELAVYKALTSIPRTTVERQVKVPIKLPTPLYDATCWKCDFLVTYDGRPEKQYLVEAKGVPTREFKLMLQYLEYFNYTDWKRLIVVTNKRIKIDRNIWSVAVDDLVECLSAKWM
ncbi:MAG TPA: hypothetical protein DCE56_06580 [Cyanobacteria bacterium UBA8553]|nr:hypothetical protein [Cyanobacteria bacterium UBA8553]HAJ59298.1 hypothetical protein [Cyanobacteria bacterium UBA8543]